MSGLRDYKAEHFQWAVDGKVATITLNRPARKNPLTFESYAALRDTFERLRSAAAINAVVLTGAGGNFCAGGDLLQLIDTLTKLAIP